MSDVDFLPAKPDRSGGQIADDQIRDALKRCRKTLEDLGTRIEHHREHVERLQAWVPVYEQQVARFEEMAQAAQIDTTSHGDH